MYITCNRFISYTQPVDLSITLAFPRLHFLIVEQKYLQLEEVEWGRSQTGSVTEEAHCVNSEEGHLRREKHTWH